MKELKEKLKKSGLTGNESKIYLELLKHDELVASKLAKKLSTDRTLTYTILNHLIEKGLVSYIIKENKKFFKAEKPENLLNPIKKKEHFVKELISELSKIQKETITPYEIKIFEGKQGLRTMMRLILKHKEFNAFGGTGRAYEQIYEIQALVKELDSKKLKAKMIIQEKYKTHPVTKIPFVKTRFTKTKTEATTTIFGDYVSIHILTEKPLIILIKNKDISKSYRNIFEELWKHAKE